ncbi:type ISP restriction/modification enzyme [Flavobacterium sp. N502536]|uniref:type ISP restriction/modification enzyme n=1 Tax=Flavobacterium sp. N502536 TaxID=2986837 RepID=UPI0022230F1C|nr:type ISP restriction/modification enzyme [Flavobacterium sp. N502536]
MRMEDYLSKINNLRLVEHRVGLCVNAELEELILKIALENSQSYFTLEVLFQKTNNNGMVLNPETVQFIANCYGLMFMDEKVTGNVCFAHSQELRPEFKQSCTTIDVLDLSYAILHSSLYCEDLKINELKIPVPQDVVVFWKLVQIGKELRGKEKE